MKRILFLSLILVVVTTLAFIQRPVTKNTALADIVKAKEEKNYPKVGEFKVPILMYHYIRDTDPKDKLGYALSVSPENFKQQIKWLKDNNYQSLTLADFADPERRAVSRIIGEDKKPVIITFDDGYLDAYTEAFPVLEKYGFGGTFFIVRNFVGKAGYLHQDQIKEMTKNQMEIGSHTLDHYNLIKLSLEALKNQIFNSKQECMTFCYPSGKFNDQTVNLVNEAGYIVAVTTQNGIANEQSDLLRLPRVRITNISLEDFAKRINGTN